MPESDNSLEGRLAVVSSDANFPAIQSVLSFPYNLPGIKDIVQVKTLDKTVFDAFTAIVIAERPQLDSDLLSANLIVPVIYYASDESILAEMNAKPEELTVARDLFLHDKNLFEICSNATLFPTIIQATEAHTKIKTYLQKNATGMKILQRQNPPRFRNALAVADRYEQSLRTLDALNRELPAHRAMWGTIVQFMLEYDRTGDPELARKLAPVVSSFLDSYPDYMLDDKAVRVMGEGETGEEPVGKVADEHGLIPGDQQFLMFREFKPRGNLTAKVVAEQKSKDSKFFVQHRKMFKTPVILRPLNFADIPGSKRDSSFTIMQYVRGTPVYKVLLKINDAFKNETDENGRAKLHLFRKSLLEQHVDDAAFFINKLPNPVGVKKPSPSELIDYYRARVADIPDAFSKRTSVVYSDDEKSLWGEATKVFGAMSVAPHHIVRNRDTSLANAGLYNVFTKQSVDDWLEIFGVTARDKINHDELAERFNNFDLQTRYGHALEDVCQIATFYEASFVFRNKSGGFTADNVLKLRDHFFDKIENKDITKDLKNDDITFYLMLVYRAVRKMQLFTDYWERTCEAFDDKRVTQHRYNERKSRFADNIKHHYYLAHTLCHKLGLELARKYPEVRGSPYKITSHAIDMNEQQAKDLLTKLSDGREGPETNLMRLHAMRYSLEKIGDHFSSRSLKHYYPTMPAQNKPEAQ